jgi:hypothetical protein
VQKFVIGEMGEKFVRPPPFDLQACYDESSCIQPLVFVLAPGSDPMASVLEAAEALGREVAPISLGQGQGPVAEALIARSRKVHGDGSWVVLQNCQRLSVEVQGTFPLYVTDATSCPVVYSMAWKLTRQSIVCQGAHDSSVDVHRPFS